LNAVQSTANFVLPMSFFPILITKILLHIHSTHSFKKQQLPVRSRLRGVWGDPSEGCFTFVNITTHKETDFKRPTYKILRKPFVVETFWNTIKNFKKTHIVLKNNAYCFRNSILHIDGS